jgi:hypothetical protein
MPFGCLSISEGLLVFEARPDWRLREMITIFEDYILYAFEKGWWPEVLDVEATVSLIKSVLGRRGAFD